MKIVLTSEFLKASLHTVTLWDGLDGAAIRNKPNNTEEQIR